MYWYTISLFRCTDLGYTLIGGKGTGDVEVGVEEALHLFELHTHGVVVPVVVRVASV